MGLISRLHLGLCFFQRWAARVSTPYHARHKVLSVSPIACLHARGGGGQAGENEGRVINIAACCCRATCVLTCASGRTPAGEAAGLTGAYLPRDRRKSDRCEEFSTSSSSSSSADCPQSCLGAALRWPGAVMLATLALMPRPV